MIKHKDKIQRAIEVQEIKEKKRIEEEKLIKEVRLLEALFDKIFKKEIKVDFDKGNHLTSSEISSCKSFFHILLYIYDLERKNTKDGEFNDASRLQALKDWYLTVKTLANLPEKPAKDSLNDIIGEKTASLFKSRGDQSLNSLLLSYQKEIKEGIKAVGIKAVAEYLHCSASSLRSFLAHKDINWYAEHLSNDFNNHSVKVAIDNVMEKLYIPPKKLLTSSKKEAPGLQVDAPSNSPEPEKKNEPPIQLSNKKRDKRKIISRKEIELRAKEIIALEDLLNSILRKELEVENGIQIANYLFNHKKHIPELMDIYNIQKQNNKGSNFTLDTRIQALQSWYLNKTKLDNQIFDSSKIISEDTAKLFRDTKINYQSLIREHLAEIKFAVEKTGFKNVAIIFGCTESALRDNLVKIDTTWYSKLIDNKNKGNNFKN